MNRLILVFSALVLAVVPACDSDSDSSSGTNGSGTSGSGSMLGLDGGLALSDLTDEQQISACEASEAYGANWEAENEEVMKSANCYMSVSFAASFSMDVPDGVESEFDCQALYDQCLAGEGPFAPDPDEEEDEYEESCDEQLVDFSECTEVTVADLESCMQAQRAIMEEMFQGFAQGTCADIEAAAMNDEEPSSGSGLSLNMEDIPECAELPDKCPPIAPSEAETETTSGPGPDALPIDTPEDAGDGEEDEAEPSDPVPADPTEP